MSPACLCFVVLAGLLPACGLSAAAEQSQPSVIVVGVGPTRAAAIAGHAEEIRQAAFAQLLEDPRPRPWEARCEIHVHATPASFAHAVGGMPATARGATSLEFGATGVVSRRIDLMGDGPEEIPDALAHELVHVVLAERFTAVAPPRWADEGVALLFDGIDKQAGHEADFRAARARGQAFSAADLLALEHYPAGAHRQRVFYGQSAALVRWLIARRDAATFIRFIADAQAGDLHAACERHYDLTVSAVFESAWKEVPPIHSLSFSNADN